MKQIYNGAGVNTTATVLAAWAASMQMLVKNLYIIGPPENPYSLFLTDNAGPLTYLLYPQQTFQKAVITRGDIPCKIGLDDDAVSLKWSPSSSTSGSGVTYGSGLYGAGVYSGSAGNTVAGANPRTLAQQGFYDNWPVLMLAAFMPARGDVNTWGCAKLFKGIIADTDVDRNEITFNVNSLKVLLGQKVPTNVIEATNSLANYSAAAPPAGFTTIPQFGTVTGSGDNVIYGDVQAPYSSGHIFTTNVFQGGYLIFIPGNGSTEAGFWGSIAANSQFTDGFGNHHNQFQIYQPLPWPPTPFVSGVGDQFIVSAPVPTTGGVGSFQFVPSPESAV